MGKSGEEGTYILEKCINCKGNWDEHHSALAKAISRSEATERECKVATIRS